MPYSIEWSGLAARQMLAFDRWEARRIAEKIDTAAASPEHYFRRLVGREELKLRIGDYRVLAIVTHLHKHIFIESVGHRKNIYKKPI